MLSQSTYSWNHISNYLNMNINEEHLTSGLKIRQSATKALIKKMQFFQSVVWPLLLSNDSFSQHLQISSTNVQKYRLSLLESIAPLRHTNCHLKMYLFKRMRDVLLFN